MRPSTKKVLVFGVIAAVIVVGLGIFAAFGPIGLYAKSESPEFCGSCHVLKTEYEAWFHSGHRLIKCIDCHLPNNNLPNHLFWKTVEGVKDSLAFHTGRVSKTIHISDHGAAVVENNCRRCHTELVSLIREDRRCWDCHRSISHKRTGTIATVSP